MIRGQLLVLQGYLFQFFNGRSVHLPNQEEQYYKKDEEHEQGEHRIDAYAGNTFEIMYETHMDQFAA